MNKYVLFLKQKKKRLTLIAIGAASIIFATNLALNALEDTLVFFYTPAEVILEGKGKQKRFRLGGIVEYQSVIMNENNNVTFAITDGEKQINVTYNGILPDLFREGQGIVAEGKINQNGIFNADTIMAKHDENYMPRELVDALKKKNIWQNNQTKNNDNNKQATNEK